MENKNVLIHYGTPRHSGRYPWGSGARPYQSGGGPAGGIRKKKVTSDSGRTSSSKPKKASELSDEELTAYNKRRAKEEQYKKYKKSEEEKDTRLNTASEIANITNRTTSNLEKAVNDAYREQHQLEKAQKDLSNMSDDELRRIVNRMNMENQYRNLTPAEVTKNEKIVKQAIASIGALTAITAASLDIAVKLKELGAFGNEKAGGVSERRLEKAKNGGSYEKRSAKKYEEAKSKYDEAHNVYQLSKAMSKTEGYNVEPNVIREAKYKRKQTKTDLKKAEKDLRKARDIDKGKELYNQGKTISSIRTKQRVSTVANVVADVAVNRALARMGAHPAARIAYNTISDGAWITNMLIAEKEKKQMRAYLYR